jgi:hypothetical protein
MLPGIPDAQTPRPAFPSWPVAEEAVRSFARHARLPLRWSASEDVAPRAEVHTLPGSGYQLRVYTAGGELVEVKAFPVHGAGSAWDEATAAAIAWDQAEELAQAEFLNGLDRDRENEGPDGRGAEQSER